MQGLLSLLAGTGLQNSAQTALPVTPNNGNPAGAHNMPWLKPSPYMDQVQTMLQQRQQALGTPMPKLPTPTQQLQTGGGMPASSVAPVIPMAKQPIPGYTQPMPQGQPVMPQRMDMRYPHGNEPLR